MASSWSLKIKGRLIVLRLPAWISSGKPANNLVDYESQLISQRGFRRLLNIPDLLVPVRRWDAIVRPALSPTSPWYAPIEHYWGEQTLSNEEPGKYRLNGFEKRLKLLFSLAKLEFKSPHKFRHGQAVFGLLHAQTMADYKAVSMNLMHESIEITDSTYAPMLPSDVQVRIAGLSGKACPRRMVN